MNAGVGLFPERHQPLVRRLLSQSAGAISGYITGNLAISVICGITTFVVLLILGMPYAAPLALLVAVLDLIPLVGATLGGALLVIVGLFVEPWKAVVLLVYIVVYQQVEGSLLQPMVYSKAVHLNGLVILDRAAGGRAAARHPGRVAGHPGGRDHPDSGNRTTCLSGARHERRTSPRLLPRRRPLRLSENAVLTPAIHPSAWKGNSAELRALRGSKKFV